MKNNKIVFISLLVISVLLFQFIKIPASHAQQNTSASGEKQIPSDLSLDLKLAQDNPDPDQKTIVASETKQAKIVTSTGEITNLKPQDVVASQVKTESAKDVEHPEQTTSEQVVSTTVIIEEKVNPSDQPESSSQPETTTETPVNTANKLVPNTNVVEPDDNAAPAPIPSTNPQTEPQQTSTPKEETNPSPTPQKSVTQPPSDNSTNNSQPTENPSAGSTNGSNQQQPQINTNTSTDSNTAPQEPSNNQPSDTSTSEGAGTSGSDQGDSDNNAVQGVSTGPTSFFQKIINFFLNFGRKRG